MREEVRKEKGDDVEDMLWTCGQLADVGSIHVTKCSICDFFLPFAVAFRPSENAEHVHIWSTNLHRSTFSISHFSIRFGMVVM